MLLGCMAHDTCVSLLAANPFPPPPPLPCRQAELARLSGDAAPQTTEDFERLVLASPNSSFVWIKYMALHLGLGDVAKARAVAERALKTINYREEGEKFNIWVAWLNLENAYGSPNPEDAAMELLHKALQVRAGQGAHPGMHA